MPFSSVTTITDDDEHDPVTKTAKITVNKLETEITASEVVTVYNDGKYLVATLKDIDGKPMEGVDILSIVKNNISHFNTTQRQLLTQELLDKEYTPLEASQSKKLKHWADLFKKFNRLPLDRRNKFYSSCSALKTTEALITAIQTSYLSTRTRNT